MSEETKLADWLIGRYEAGLSRRSNWNGLWDDASRYILPQKGRLPATTANNPGGESQTRDIYDSTANESALTFAAGLLSSLVPAGELWFRYSARPGASEEVVNWLDDCTHRAAAALHASNFYLGIHEDFQDMAGFSVSSLFTDEGAALRGQAGGLLNFTNVPVGTFVIEEDAEARVDSVFREFFFTPRQARDKWGEDKLSKEMRDALNSKAPSDQARQFRILHCVYPRRDHAPGLTVGSRRPIASVFVDMQARHMIEEDGYYEMPVSVARLLRGNNEIYGRGPGDQAMPDIKMLNRMCRDYLLSLEGQVNPPWLAPQDSAWRPDNRPGGVIYWDSSRPENKPERLRDTARVDMADVELQRRREVVRRAFFVHMFEMLNNPDVLKQKMTAFQVAQMLQEKMVLFHPMFARITQEKLNPLLARVFNILLRAGIFAPPPLVDGEELEYEIDYVSRIALAIKQAQTAALGQSMEMFGAMAQFDQSVPLIIDWQKAARGVARNGGLPQEWQRSEDEVAEMLQAQAQANQMAQMEQVAKAANQAAGAAQKLGPDAQRAATEALGGATS